MAYTISTNSSSSTLSNYNTYLIKSITLASSSSSLSLKTSVISRLSIKSIVLPSLFTSIYIKWLIIPLQRSLPQAHCRAYIIAVILSLGKIILTYSCCANKKLIYITITAPSSRQPSSYSKCTSINMQLSYNIRSVSNVEYISHILRCLRSSYSSNRNT